MFKKYVSSKLLKECFAAFVLNHGAFLTGFSLSYPACLIPQLKHDGYKVNTFIESILGSISILVIGLTTFVVMFLVGWTSRIKITRLSLIVFAFGTIIVIFAWNISTLVIGLMIQSTVVSIFTPVTITYLSEVVQKQHRGSLLSSIFLSITIGLSFNYIVISVFSWRILAATALAVSLSEYLQTFILPESSYWYLLQDDKEAAKKSLLWFEPTLVDDDVNRRVETILQTTDSATHKKGCQFFEIMSSLRHKENLKPVLIGLVMNAFRSGNGRVILGIYIEPLFRRLNTSYDVETLIRWYGWADIIGSTLTMLFVHKMKRKPLMVLSSSTLIVTLGFVIVYKFVQNTNFALPDWLPVASLYVYTMVVMTSYNSVTTTIISEIQTPVYRAQMVLFQIGIGYLFMCFYSFLFPYVDAVLDIQYILMWFVLNIFLCLLSLLILVPETSKFEFYENEKHSTANFMH